MAPRDQALARQRAQRATARALREGRPTLPPKITTAYRQAVSRAQLERAFGDLPYKRNDPIRIRDRDGYNGRAVGYRLGKTDAASKQQVFDKEYWEDLEYEGDDDDDPFWYH